MKYVIPMFILFPLLTFACPPCILMHQYLEEADIVISGKIEKVEKTQNNNWIKATIKIKNVYKGKNNSNIINAIFFTLPDFTVKVKKGRTGIWPLAHYKSNIFVCAFHYPSRRPTGFRIATRTSKKIKGVWKLWRKRFLARNSNNIKLLQQLTLDKDDIVKGCVASNRYVSKDTLEKFQDNKMEFALMYALALNEKTPLQLLMEIVGNGDYFASPIAYNNFVKRFSSKNDAISFIFQSLKRTEQKKQIRAAKFLSTMGRYNSKHIPKSYLSELLKVLLDSKQKDIRFGIIEAIGNMRENGDRAAPVLVSLFSYSSDQVKKAIIKSIGKMKVEERFVVDFLISAFSEKNIEVKIAIAELIANMRKKDPSFVNIMILGLKHPNLIVRLRSIRAISHLNCANNFVVSNLITCLDDTNQHVVISATRTLANFRKKSKVAVPKLLLLKDKNKDLALGKRWHIEKASKSSHALISLHGGFSFSLNVEKMLHRQVITQGVHVFAIELPYHMHRQPKGSFYSGHYLISGDIIRMIKGFLQAEADVRSLILALRKIGYRHIILGGTSFGGNIAAQVITKVEVDQAYLMMPVFSPYFTYWQNFCGKGIRNVAMKEGYCENEVEKAMQTITPEHLGTPLLDLQRLFFIYGKYDMIASTDILEQMRKKWGAPDTKVFSTGHITILTKWRTVRRILAQWVSQYRNYGARQATK